MKTKTQFTCSACGYHSPRWMGQCSGCEKWNTLEEQLVKPGPHGPGGRRVKSEPARTLGEIDGETLSRYRTGIDEFDRVLGGGLVPGSLILVAGDPGIGKSTLLLQAASAYARAGLRVLYVSAEESERQLLLRSRRLGEIHEGIGVLAGTRLEEIAPIVESGDLDVVIVDSVQTLHHQEGSAPGSVGQVRDNTLYFMELAKRTQISVLLVGHVTKDGTVAGPRVMEHMVDAVLYLEGDHFHHYRMLRATKNRFGPTFEVGMFDMGESGLTEVKNPSEFLLAERREGTAGSVVAVILEGTRPLLLEIQALVGTAGYNAPRRVATGVDSKRLAVLLAVLERRAGMNFSASDVFVNVAGGFRVAEPAVDLAVAMAVVSSTFDMPLDPNTAVMGEIGLGGEIRRVAQLSLRLREASKLGFKNAMVPKRGGAQGADLLNVIPVSRIEEAVEIGFPNRRSLGRAPIETSSPEPAKKPGKVETGVVGDPLS